MSSSATPNTYIRLQTRAHLRHDYQCHFQAQNLIAAVITERLQMAGETLALDEYLRASGQLGGYSGFFPAFFAQVGLQAYPRRLTAGHYLIQLARAGGFA